MRGSVGDARRLVGQFAWGSNSKIGQSLQNNLLNSLM